MGRLSGKVCVITGGGSRPEGVGNGGATAVVFAREGARVLIQGRTAEGPQRTADAIHREGGQAEVFVGDVAEAGAASALAEKAKELWGRLDVLHNNIGISGYGSVVDVEESAWDEVFRVNVKTMMLCSRFAIPLMAACGGGSIINVSSASAVRPKGRADYTASKGAVNALTIAMAVDHGPEHIRVNALGLGPIYSPRQSTRPEMTEQRREERRLASVLEIEGTPWDIAHAGLFLASEESRYITGAIIPVDGGTILRGPQR